MRPSPYSSQKPAQGMPLLSLANSFHTRQRAALPENSDIQLPFIEKHPPRVLVFLANESVSVFFLIATVGQNDAKDGSRSSRIATSQASTKATGQCFHLISLHVRRENLSFRTILCRSRQTEPNETFVISQNVVKLLLRVIIEHRNPRHSIREEISPQLKRDRSPQVNIDSVLRKFLLRRDFLQKMPIEQLFHRLYRPTVLPRSKHIPHRPISHRSKSLLLLRLAGQTRKPASDC